MPVEVKSAPVSADSGGAMVPEPRPEPAAKPVPAVEEQPVSQTEPVASKPPVKTEQITSPMVGTFYSRSRPEAPPFVEKGDVVEPGQTLCIVEAMKLMNEIQAEKKCRIIEILVKDGESVEYGEPLMVVEPL